MAKDRFGFGIREREPEGYQEGGEIKIKPSKVGSFTAW